MLWFSVISTQVRYLFMVPSSEFGSEVVLCYG